MTTRRMNYELFFEMPTDGYGNRLDYVPPVVDGTVIGHAIINHGTGDITLKNRR